MEEPKTPEKPPTTSTPRDHKSGSVHNSHKLEGGAVPLKQELMKPVMEQELQNSVWVDESVLSAVYPSVNMDSYQATLRKVSLSCCESSLLLDLTLAQAHATRFAQGPAPLRKLDGSLSDHR